MRPKRKLTSPRQLDPCVPRTDLTPCTRLCGRDCVLANTAEYIQSPLRIPLRIPLCESHCANPTGFPQRSHSPLTALTLPAASTLRACVRTGAPTYTSSTALGSEIMRRSHCPHRKLKSTKPSVQQNAPHPPLDEHV